MVYQDTLLACQYMDSSLYPKLYQDCILDFFTVVTANFCAMNAKHVWLCSSFFGYFACWMSSFTYWFHHVVTFLSFKSLHRVVSIHIPDDQMKLLSTAATPPPRPLCIPMALGTRTISYKSLLASLTTNVFYIFR